MAWRQLRGAVVSTAALTAVLVIVLVVMGAVSRGVDRRAAAACAANDAVTCGGLQDQLGDLFLLVARYLGYLPLTSVLVAAVWGAPMISREIEAGTAALAWHQSVTRRRWLAARLAVSVVVLIALGLLLGFAVTWWAGSFGALSDSETRVASLPVSYGPLTPTLWIVGLAIGILIGTLVRRALPAATVTAVVVFVGVVTFGIVAGFPAGEPSTGLQVLVFQLQRALPLLALAAVAGALSFRQLTRIQV